MLQAGAVKGLISTSAVMYPREVSKVITQPFGRNANALMCTCLYSHLIEFSSNANCLRHSRPNAGTVLTKRDFLLPCDRFGVPCVLVAPGAVRSQGRGEKKREKSARYSLKMLNYRI